MHYAVYLIYSYIQLGSRTHRTANKSTYELNSRTDFFVPPDEQILTYLCINYRHDWNTVKLTFEFQFLCINLRTFLAWIFIFNFPTILCSSCIGICMIYVSIVCVCVCDSPLLFHLGPSLPHWQLHSLLLSTLQTAAIFLSCSSCQRIEIMLSLYTHTHLDTQILLFPRGRHQPSTCNICFAHSDSGSGKQRSATPAWHKHARVNCIFRAKRMLTSFFFPPLFFWQFITESHIFSYYNNKAPYLLMRCWPGTSTFIAAT